jgi:hypothetical protein
MSDTYDFDADRMTGETRGVITRAEALLANVTPGAWVICADPDDRDFGTFMVKDAPLTADPIAYGNVNSEVHFNNPADAAFIAAAPQLVRDLLAEIKRLRAIEPPDGYWWVIREDADGNEISRELKPLDPPEGSAK